MKRTLKKLLICICVFLVLFNQLGLNCIRVEAAGDSVSDIASSVNGTGSDSPGEKIGKVLSGIVGILTWGLRLPFAVAPLIIQSIGGVVANMEGKTSHSTGGAAAIFLTPETVIFDEIHLTSIDFFNLSDSTLKADGAVKLIREQIALWYYVMRVIAIGILLGILIFVGIKMAITTIASEKAIYKKALFHFICWP